MSWLIYKHTNSFNGKCYVGQTCKTNPNYRWNDGKGYTKRNPNSHFARAIKKYGWDSFTHEIIEKDITSQELANQRESFWITYFNSVENGYNSNYGGNNKTPSKETREKLSANSKKMWAQKGDKLREIYSSKKHREKLSNSIKQTYLLNPDLKKQISESRKKKITITNGIETKIINSDELPFYKRQNYQRGAVYIKFELLAEIINDYTGENDLSIHELSAKYGFDYKIIQRALLEMGVPLVNKNYKVWNKVRGTKRSNSFKQKHSEIMRAQRKGKIWVNKDGISKSIDSSDEINYLNGGWKRGRGKISSTNMTHDSQKKKVIDLKTGVVYDSIRDAARDLNVSKSLIQNIVNKRPHCKTAKGHPFEFYNE